MRIDRFTVGSLLVICACVAASAAPKGSAAPGGLENGQPLAAMAGGDGTASAADGVVLVDGDAALMASEGETAFVVVPQTCETFGSAELDARGVDRYRGNIYRVEYTGTLLNEIKMEFAFFGDVPMTFSVRAAPSGDMPQVFRRLDGVNDVTVTHTGVGLPALFSSGPVNIALAKGFDYAIGVSWGRVSAGGSTVTYFNGSRQYPLPFTHGQVIKRVLLNNALPDEWQFTLSSSTGAYSMELCFTPVPGACCSAAGCNDADIRDACAATGSFYHGDRSDCREIACRIGACCDPCGTCQDSFTPEACTIAEGAFEFGAVCSTNPTDLCPRIVGACCDLQGGCDDTTCARECEQRGDTYLGDGTTCQPNMCAGACCVPGGCTESTSSDCFDASGAFKGNGTTCATLPPELECGGACCHGFATVLDTCVLLDRRGTCTSLFPLSAYLGDGTTCPVDDPTVPTDGCVGEGPFGACCLPDGTCINTTGSLDQFSGFCAQPWVNGDYKGDGTTCDSVACSTGSCCLPDGSCQELTQQACGGAWTPGGTCLPNICNQPIGACCGVDAGVCAETTEADCLLAGDFYQGDGTVCGVATDTCPGVGACCRDIGDCLDGLAPGECVMHAGAYQGDGTLCDDPNVACDQRGACCTETGICLFVLQEECFDLGGLFTVGESCQTATCIAGACCITAPGADARCELRRADACPDDGVHVYQGDDSVCDPDVCTVAACCLPVGGCVNVFGFECFQQSGEFSVGADCTVANACDLGACCISGVCTVESGAACTSREGFYQGPSVPCQAGMCDLGSCCERTNTCTPDVVQTQCDATNGLDFRAGVSCASPLPCDEIGACCLRDGTCLDAVTTTVCEAQNGRFTPTIDPALCGNLNCPVRGACCADGGCVEITSAECAALSGVYEGDFVVCAADLCTLGSCCLLDGTTCRDADVRSECDAVRGSFRADITCSGVACNRSGACCTRDGVCTDGVLESRCTLNDGTPTADFLCSAVPCVGEGACCDTVGGCTEGTQISCVNAGGVYQGDDTVCGASSCPIGACCNSGLCHEESEASCNGGAGLYLGGATRCDASSCVPGACCHLDGSCDSDVLSSQCDTAAFDVFSPFDSCAFACLVARGACCVPGLPCDNGVTELGCTNAGGTYDGDGTVCRPNLCAVGACCLPVDPGPVCNDVNFTQQACEVAGGAFQGAGVQCAGGDQCSSGSCCQADGICIDDVVASQCGAPNTFRLGVTCLDTECVAVGACCIPGVGCQIQSAAVCGGLSGSYGGDATTCQPADLCDVGACCRVDEFCVQKSRLDCERQRGNYSGSGSDCVLDNVECRHGACCQTTAVCTDDALASDCSAAGAEFSPNITCAQTTCNARGACCSGTVCTIDTRSDCLQSQGGGIYQGTGVDCGPGVCAISIISSDPPNCSIDAAQPFRPDGSDPGGWDTLELTFDGDATGLTVDSFTPSVLGISTLGNTATITIAPIATGGWTCITHNDSGKQICLGFLPADSGGDGLVSAADVTTLIDCFNGNATCDLWQCDLDRSGTCGPADLLRGIDLMGGTEMFSPGWLDQSIGACPSQAP